MRALTHDGLDEGSQSTKYTQVALKKGTSLGPSLFTWKTWDKGSIQSMGAQRGAQSRTLSPGIHPKTGPPPKQGGLTQTQCDLPQTASVKEPVINLRLK